MNKKKRKFLCFVLKVLIMLATILDLIISIVQKLIELLKI